MLGKFGKKLSNIIIRNLSFYDGLEIGRVNYLQGETDIFAIESTIFYRIN